MIALGFFIFLTIKNCIPLPSPSTLLDYFNLAHNNQHILLLSYIEYSYLPWKSSSLYVFLTQFWWIKKPRFRENINNLLKVGRLFVWHLHCCWVLKLLLVNHTVLLYLMTSWLFSCGTFLIPLRSIPAVD